MPMAGHDTPGESDENDIRNLTNVCDTCISHRRQVLILIDFGTSVPLDDWPGQVLV